MYNEHFGLQQAPFRITPDTRLFFEGGGRGEILDALVYAIVSGEGIVAVIGEVGTGKTMLCRMLEERLPEHVEIVYLANPSLKPDDILQAIALEMNLDIAPGSNRLKVMHAMQQRLLEKHASNRQVVVFVEEAQSMPIETLEEIRLLSNLETKREKLLQIVLFGQPELDEKFNQPNIRQLKERITHSFYLEPLNRKDLRDYVNFRMRTVGYKGPDVFRSSAYLFMARASEGLTRRINILADKALLAAFANDRHEVTLKDVRKAINDSQFESRRGRFPRIALALCVLALAGAAAWSLFDPLEHVAGTSADTGAMSTPATRAPAAGEVISPPTAAVAAETPAPTQPEPAVPNKVVLAASVGPTAGISTPEPEPKPKLQVSAAGAESGPRDGAAASHGAALIATAARAAMLSPNGAPDPRNSAANIAASAASDLIAARLAVTRQWLSRADNDHYSIQLLLTPRSQRRNVEAFLEQRSREGEIEHVYVYETVIDDRPYLGVLYREFSGYSAAKRALEDLPRDLKRLGPFIRNVRDVTSVLEHVAGTSADTGALSTPATRAPAAGEVISPPTAAVAAETPAPTQPEPAVPNKVVLAASVGPTAGISTPEPEPKPKLQVSAAGAESGPRDGAAASHGAALIAAAARAAMLSPNGAPDPRNSAANIAASAASDLIAARLAVTRQWLSRADNDHYSIQLLLTPRSQRRNVEAFLEQRSREGEIEHVYVYETVIDDRPYLGVLYREFSSYSAAKRALEDLPRDLKRLGPFIRNVRDVTTVG